MEKRKKWEQRRKKMRHCSLRGISLESTSILVLILVFVCDALPSMKYLNVCFQLILHWLLNHFERLWFPATKCLLNKFSDFKRRARRNITWERQGDLLFWRMKLPLQTSVSWWWIGSTTWNWAINRQFVQSNSSDGCSVYLQISIHH